ncbi:MAG: sugar ABC transporter permease [Ruminococcaceae bacterium]|nr:sugar ABC transporter permease [Oscillospiraceae bacterium]
MAKKEISQVTSPVQKGRRCVAFAKAWKKHWILYMMFIPVAVYYLLFYYKPMYGILMAFQDYQPMKGMLGSDWVGFMHFKDFFQNYYFWRIVKNTVIISGASIIFGFPAPIILALLLNEVGSTKFKRSVQTISYMPHFISMVVICGMIRVFVADNGIITDLLVLFGMERQPLLSNPDAFVPILVISEIWQGMGWGSIIYLAALTGIDQTLYEAAVIDGANRWKQTLHVTIPGIAPTIIIMLILRLGSILSVGYEKIILLYNPLTYETGDVISSFVYRKGLQEMNWSYSTAVGLFNSVVNFVFLMITNSISRRVSETSLW